MSFLKNLTWRYATKKYNGSPVSDESLHSILNAIRFAPSANGAQPYHIIVAHGALKDRLIESSGQTDKLGASHLLVFCTRTDYPYRAEELLRITAEVQNVPLESLSGYKTSLWRAIDKPQDMLRAWAGRQTYIALGFALAAAAELSVDASPMEGFKPDEFKRILTLPEYLDPVVIMALGYRDPSDTSQPQFRKKVRFPESDLFEFRN